MFVQKLSAWVLHSVDEMIRKDRPYRKMMKDFDERLKRTFRDSSDQELMDCDLGNAVRDDFEKRVEDGFLEVTRQEMKEIFDPVIQEILRLVREQIDTVSSKSQDRVSVSQPTVKKLHITIGANCHHVGVDGRLFYW